jgi:Sulfotransferase family
MVRDGERPVRVAYVAGFGRSGSTLLGNLLGQLDGALAVGELRHLWTRGVLESRRCGCGELVPACPLWSAVLDEPGLQADPGGVARTVACEARTSAPTTTAALLAPGATGGIVTRRLDGYGRQLVDLYRALQRVSGASMVVDTSKAPGGAWLVRSMPGVDLRVIHLVRDPRATAYSWSRSKPIDDGGSRSRMVTLGPVRSSAHWLLRNVATRSAFGADGERYRLVRYEDLIDRPRIVLADLAGWLGLSGALPLVDDHTAVLATVHGIGGNPDRDHTGVVRLDLDDAWRRDMPAGPRRLSELVTLPVRRSFGYGRYPSPPPALTGGGRLHAS